ncbi:MAG TPA: hypothetical protein VJQ25_12200, partial [Nitrospira sp.]|nr:hypothetical protein [Nitrospira sp.]
YRRLFNRWPHGIRTKSSRKEALMKARIGPYSQACLVLAMIGLIAASAYAEPYELSKNDVMDPKAIKSPDISLFGVKIGDSEAKAMDVLINEKIPGIKVEQEALFIFLVDQRKPTGPMAGVRVQDGKVDMIFINNRFAYKTRGLLRNFLNSESPEDIRKLLGHEDYGDENVMGAVLAYDKQGFVINYLGKDVNIEFSPVH